MWFLMRKETAELDSKIRELIPVGKEVRMKEILDKVKAKRICAPNAVERRLIEWEKKGHIKKRTESHKEVYYRRCEDVRLENQIDEFLNDLERTLGKLPNEWKDVKQKLKDGSGTLKEGMEAVEVLRSDPDFLKQWVLMTLAQKVVALLNDNIPDHREGKFRWELTPYTCGITE
jgi:hypothetical protein